MPAKDFLDTNVLIYAMGKNDPRASKAEALLGERRDCQYPILERVCFGGASQIRYVLERVKRVCGSHLHFVPRPGSNFA